LNGSEADRSHAGRGVQGGFHGKSAVAFWSARVRRGACRREQLEAEWQRGRAAGGFGGVEVAAEPVIARVQPLLLPFLRGCLEALRRAEAAVGEARIEQLIAVAAVNLEALGLRNPPLLIRVPPGRREVFDQILRRAAGTVPGSVPLDAPPFL